jgi:AraC-like DNA-binding protein
MSNRVVAFNVPQTEHEVVRVQSDVVPYFYDQVHQHPEIQLMHIEAGEGTLIAGDYVGRFRPGDVFAIGSGQPHVFRCDQSFYERKSSPAKSISMYFSEKYFGRELWESNELASVREFAASTRFGSQFLGNAAREAAERMRKLTRCDGLEKMIAFFSLLQLLVQTDLKKRLSLQPGGLQVSEEGRMNSIVEFTFRESHRKIYLTEVARLANLSLEAFCRYFKLHTRKTYINFLNEVRVSHACQLLIQEESSIQQVCYQSGFSNVSNFNRIFKKITGKTPHSFRKQLPFHK